MELTRTTLRVRTDLKKAAARRALETDTTLQEIFNRALESYLEQEAKREAKKIVFRTHNLGEPLDHLTRDDYYDAP